MKLLAQHVTILNEQFRGPLKIPGVSGTTVHFADIVNIVLSFIFALSGIVILYFFITSGFQILLSEGDSGKISAAQKRMTFTVVGFILIVSAYTIARVVGVLFGLGNGILP